MNKCWRASLEPGNGWVSFESDGSGYLDLSIHVNCLRTRVIRASAAARTFVNIMRPHCKDIQAFRPQSKLLMPGSFPVRCANANYIWKYIRNLCWPDSNLINRYTSAYLTIQTCTNSLLRMFDGKHLRMDGGEKCEQLKTVLMCHQRI